MYGHIDPRKRTENLEINPHIYRQSIFKKVVKRVQEKITVFSTADSETINWIATCKTKNKTKKHTGVVGPLLHHTQKLTQKGSKT